MMSAADHNLLGELQQAMNAAPLEPQIHVYGLPVSRPCARALESWLLRLRVAERSTAKES